MKVDKRQILCVAVGITFFLAGSLVDSGTEAALKGRAIARNTYGQGDKEEFVTVEGLLEKETEIPVFIQERQYGKTEAEAAFERAQKELKNTIAGQNESLDAVRTDLKLTAGTEDGIAIEWLPDQSGLIDISGKVFNENCSEKGEACSLTAVLKAGSYRREYVFSVRVYPPVRSEEEMRMSDFQKVLTVLDKEQANRESILLPENYEGKVLSYHQKRQSKYWIFLLLGIAAAVLLPLRDKQKEKEVKKKREEQMLLDYSEIVSKLVVFIGAGLPIRKSWERIVADYERKSKQSNLIRYAYEEMKAVYYLMGRGMPEARAYAEFGNRCRILPYRKLAGLLEQNLKNGTDNLRSVLETEMRDAFEQRKTLAKRLGEEAGTKLLLPLFMMLIVVMVMITVPAFLSYGF